MLFPDLISWMEQRDNADRAIVDTGEVRAFVKAASVARERKIAGSVAAAVLARNDVVDMKRSKRRIALSQPAVLAAIFGALPYQCADRPLHQDAALSLRISLAFACRIDTTSMAST